MPYRQRLVIDINGLQRKVRNAASKRTQLAGLHLVSVLQRDLAGQRSGRSAAVPGSVLKPVRKSRRHWKTGKRYTQRYWRARTRYRVSLPGELPAVRLGFLRGSVAMLRGADGETLVGSRSFKNNYGRALELRKKNPRPWLRPTYEKTKTALVNIIERRWDEMER